MGFQGVENPQIMEFGGFGMELGGFGRSHNKTEMLFHRNEAEQFAGAFNPSIQKCFP